MLRTVTTAFVLAITSTLATAQEVIGPWVIGATPITASASTGVGNVGWINIVDAPVTPEEAFAGADILERGFANFEFDQAIDMEFAPGDLVNLPGDDFVVFDARYDDGSYYVATSFDAYSTRQTLEASTFQDTGETRTYIYELTGNPLDARAWGRAVELSDLGIPDGAVVTDIRLVTANVNCDLLGIGVIKRPIGSPYCTANPNSTGVSGTLSAAGSVLTGNNDVTLACASLPTRVIGYFLASLTQDFVPDVGGGEGNLCVGGNIGRFVGAGQILNTGANGTLALEVDLTSIPQSTGIVAGMAGDTWNFQAWHRDQVGSQMTSNLTNGLSLTLR